jgi:hypothetical protein
MRMRDEYSGGARIEVGPMDVFLDRASWKCKIISPWASGWVLYDVCRRPFCITDTNVVYAMLKRHTDTCSALTQNMYTTMTICIGELHTAQPLEAC